MLNLPEAIHHHGVVTASPGGGDKDPGAFARKGMGSEKPQNSGPLKHPLPGERMGRKHSSYLPKEDFCLGFKSKRKQKKKKKICPENSSPRPCPWVELRFKCVPPARARKPKTEKLSQDGRGPGHLTNTRENPLLGLNGGPPECQQI